MTSAGSRSSTIKISNDYAFLLSEIEILVVQRILTQAKEISISILRMRLLIDIRNRVLTVITYLATIGDVRLTPAAETNSVM